MAINYCKKYSVSLQSLKGLAAIIVFMGHALGMYHNEYVASYKSTAFNILSDGQCAVAIFFCLTGFFSYREQPLNLKSYVNSIRRKAIRIYPAYLLVMILGWFIANSTLSYDKTLFTDWCNSFWNETISLKYLLTSLALVLPFDSNVLNPPVWYLCTDMRIAFIIPVITCLICKIEINRFKIITTILLIFVAVVFQPPFGLMFLSYYGGGILLKIILLHYNSVSNFLSNFRHALIILLLGIVFLDIYNILGWPESVAPGYIRIIQVFGSMLIVSVFYNCNFGWLNKLFYFAGEISYEFYLVHFVVLLTLRPISIPIFIYILVSAFISCIIAYLLNKFVSKPFRYLL